MPIDALVTWSGLAAICSLVLFVEAVSLFRLIFAVRQASWRYLLVVIPLAVSAWSFTVATHAWHIYQNWVPWGSMMWVHISLAWWNNLKMLLQGEVYACQLAVGIAVVAFALMLYLQRRMFPRDVRAPAWVVAREHLIRCGLSQQNLQIRR